MRKAILLLVFAVATCAFGTEPEAGLPSRDPARVIPLLQALPPASTYGDVLRILGKPNLELGTGIPDAIFILNDDSRVHVTTRIHLPDFVSRVKAIIAYPPHRAVNQGEGKTLFPAPRAT